MRMLCSLKNLTSVSVSPNEDKCMHKCFSLTMSDAMDEQKAMFV